MLDTKYGHNYFRNVKYGRTSANTREKTSQWKRSTSDYLTVQNFTRIDRCKRFSKHKTVLFFFSLHTNISKWKPFQLKLCAEQVMSEKKPYDNVEFDWIQLSADIDPGDSETFLAKWKRKFEENPFVPIGEYDFSAT